MLQDRDSFIIIIIQKDIFTHNNPQFWKNCFKVDFISDINLFTQKLTKDTAIYSFLWDIGIKQKDLWMPLTISLVHPEID